ncbi:hypothetical protein DYB30_008565 [Aphanomyces astaci]|uniref:Uncharacterized protein n=1 Tax=Aphanomyces astaci TaxID=112090 RepID=A0A397D6Z7_APHAT|nr:hypothetical protein DYB30_008565 [Aphanomyces astaci]
MASRRGVPMLDTASAAAVQQKNLRIIETFIASENSRELQLAQCKSVEKRGLLEMEFALARAHESKLLHRMMRKGDDSDRLEDEVHAMVVASSKRMHDIEAISSLPRSPFVKKKPPKRRVAAPATSYTTVMPAIKPRLRDSTKPVQFTRSFRRFCKAQFPHKHFKFTLGSKTLLKFQLTHGCRWLHYKAAKIFNSTLRRQTQAL